MRQRSYQTAVRTACKELIGRPPASAVVVVIVKDNEPAWAQHLYGLLKTELDRIVPIAIKRAHSHECRATECPRSREVAAHSV